MTIQLQDDKKQNDLESLNVVLFDNDTIDVRNGQKVIVRGSLDVVQQKSNGKRVTYVFADTSGIKNEESQSDGEGDAPLTEQYIRVKRMLKEAGILVMTAEIAKEAMLQ